MYGIKEKFSKDTKRRESPIYEIDKPGIAKTETPNTRHRTNMSLSTISRYIVRMSANSRHTDILQTLSLLSSVLIAASIAAYYAYTLASKSRQQYKMTNENSIRTQSTMNQETTTNSRTQSTMNQEMRMYGDLVNGMCYSAFLPVYLYLWINETDSTKWEGAKHINFAFAWTAVFCWYSYLFVDPLASTLAFLGMSTSIAGMDLYQWPHFGEVVVVPQFLWSLLIIGANTPLLLAYKCGLAIIALATAVAVAVQSPLLSVTDTLPLLLVATGVHVVFHYYTSTNWFDEENKSFISAHAASLILAGSFVYHVSSEIVTMYRSPGYASEGGYSILRAGFFSAVGLAAAGSFRREIDIKEALEVLVEVRAKEINKQAEQLRVVEHALQASETAIAITDSDQHIIWSNAALERLTNMTAAQQHNASLLDALNTSNMDGLQKGLSPNFLKTQREIMVNSKYVELESAPFPSAKDEHYDGSRFLVVLKDITEQRARERAEKAAEREALVAKTMNESMQTLSHELRTPLQGIMGITSLMISEPDLPKDVTELLSMIMVSARLLLTLINNMLDVRKCDADMMDTFQLGPTQLAPSLSDAVAFCKPFAVITDVGLEVCVGETGDVVVEANTLRFQQVMINLISNAIKYSTVGTNVSVSAKVMTLEEAEDNIANALFSAPHDEEDPPAARRSGMQVAAVSVSDEGTGIPETEESRRRIFGRFSQLEHSATTAIGGTDIGQPSGTGIGLNLCMEFVHRMKGEIWVTNNPNRGSRFSFYLPVIADDTSINSAPKVGSVLPRNSSVISSGLPPALVPETNAAAQFRVLLVDDSILNLKILRRMLERLGVEKITTVDSGKKALAALKDGDFNLVLTDLQMPEMSGDELSRTIRDSSSDMMDTIPLVVGLTAETRDSVDTLCEESGMALVLHKPITTDELKAFFDKLSDGHCRGLGNDFLSKTDED